jgi:hypothetical protein
VDLSDLPAIVQIYGQDFIKDKKKAIVYFGDNIDDIKPNKEGKFKVDVGNSQFFFNGCEGDKEKEKYFDDIISFEELMKKIV